MSTSEIKNLVGFLDSILLGIASKFDAAIVVEVEEDEPRVAGELPLYLSLLWGERLTLETVHEFDERLRKLVNAVLEPWRIEVLNLTYFLDELVDIIRKVMKEGKAEIRPASISAQYVLEPDIPEVKIVLEKVGEVKAYHLEPNTSYILKLQKVRIPLRWISCFQIQGYSQGL